MPYQSIFTPNSQKNFSQDFQPGQYAKINGNIVAKQDTLLNPPQQTQGNGNSLISKIKRVAQTVGTDVAQGTGKAARAIARPVIDVATGQGGKAVHDTAQLANDVTGGAAGYFAENDIINPAKQIIAQATHNQKAYDEINQKKNIDLGLGAKGTDIKSAGLKLAGNAVDAALIPVGGGEVAGAKQIIKSGGEAVAKDVGKKIAKDAAIGAVGGAAGTVAENPQATAKEIVKNTAIGGATGAAIPAAAHSVGLAAKKAFSGGADEALSSLKETDKGGAMQDVMSPEQLDKAAAAVHTQILPKDESAGAEQVGVRTPIRPGIKQQSTTYNVGVRTPQRMTDDQYTKEFKFLSNSYDKEMGSLKDKPPVTQKALAEHIDNKYQVLIGDLNDRYKNGTLPKETTVKRVASETSPAEKTTGGAPKSGVNVPRSSRYQISDTPRVTPEEATQKLQSAGYSPDETKTILQDALPEKGLAMPGNKPQVKLNDESVQKSAANLDKSNGETMPESSNLNPLSETSTSEKGTSKLASSVQEKALQDKLISKTDAEAEDLPQYNKANLKEQAQFTSELIKSDPQRAINIALGKEEAPAHILPQMVYNGVEEYARHIGGEDGGKLLLDLSRSKRVTNLTTMAQNVRAAAERDPHSPTNMINDVAVARAQKVKGGNAAVAAAIKADARAVKAATPKIKPDDWTSFVNGLRC